MNKNVLGDLNLAETDWELAQKRAHETREQGVNGEELEQLVNAEKRMKAVYDKSTLEHPLEAGSLYLYDRKRRWNGSQRKNKFHPNALFRDRASTGEAGERKKQKQKLSTEEVSDESLPDAHTMRALLDDMDTAGLW